MRRSQRPVVGLFLLLFVLALAIGCREDVPPLFRSNQRPETFLHVVPEDSARGFYRYHVYWRGEDPDGRVVRFLFAITDTLTDDDSEDWDPTLADDRDRGVYTSKTDSVFLFDAFRGRQALHMVAIDDFGDLDRTPERAFFFTFNNGLPTVDLLDVQPFRDDASALAPCAAEQCTVATFTNFKVRFRGTTRNGGITGYQWQAAFPGEPAEAMQPFGSDSLFLAAGTDTTAVDADGDTLWALQGDIVTVYYYNRYGDTDVIRPGSFIFSATVRDDARLISDQLRQRIVVNYDGDTRLARVPACDCPNPPPNCSSADSVRAGWITGFDQTEFADPSQWILFCDGDTIPQRSRVHLYARGTDDARDLPIDPSQGQREVGFSWRYEYCGDDGEGSQSCNNVVPFSAEAPAADLTLPPPLNTAWRGQETGIGNQTFPGICPFDYRFFASAVDEWGRPDGTPDAISVFVSGSPSFDSLAVPNVVVLVPACPPFFSNLCPDTTGVRFGPDTLMCFGTVASDPSSPCLLGANQFELPLRAFAHDHPRDRRLEFQAENQGRVQAWLFRFTCADGGCEDYVIGGEGQWRNDGRPGDEPIERQVFDDVLRITSPLDTLELLATGGCTDLNTRAVVPAAKLGRHRFELQGRDTPVVPDVTCATPTTLPDSVGAPINVRVGDVGRRTERFVRTIRLVNWKDVRPAKAGAASDHQWTSPRRLSR